MAKDILDSFLAKRRIRANQRKVNPYEYPDKRIDDWQGGPPQSSVAVTTNNEPIIDIQTITDSQYRRLTGERPGVEPKIVRVSSPVFTTQPIITLERDDIRRANPQIRVVEGGRGTPEGCQPFINPYTMTDPNSHSSLLEEGKADTRGKSLTHSTTPQYDAMKEKMNHMMVNIDGEEMDILLPIHAKTAEAVARGVKVTLAGTNAKDENDTLSGVPISIGGIPGSLAIKSNVERVGTRPDIGNVRKVKYASWDGQEGK